MKPISLHRAKQILCLALQLRKMQVYIRFDEYVRLDEYIAQLGRHFSEFNTECRDDNYIAIGNRVLECLGLRNCDFGNLDGQFNVLRKDDLIAFSKLFIDTLFSQCK